MQDIDLGPTDDVTPIDPNGKCGHGLYNPRYCSVCNPDANNDRVLHLAMARRKPVNRNYPEAKTLGADDFINQHVGARLAAAVIYE